jgi:hypothetical protein
LISKLFFTKGGGGPWEGVGPESHIKLTTYRIQNKDAAKLCHKIINVYVFFLNMALGL